MTPDPQVISLQDVEGLIERLEEAASALRALQARVEELERAKRQLEIQNQGLRREVAAFNEDFDYLAGVEHDDD